MSNQHNLIFNWIDWAVYDLLKNGYSLLRVVPEKTSLLRVVPRLREEIEWSLNMSNYFTHAFGYQPAEISKLVEISATRFVVCCDLHTCLQSVGLPPSLQSLWFQLRLEGGRQPDRLQTCMKIMTPYESSFAHFAFRLVGIQKRG